jgi:hypothetical protein
MIGTPNHTGDCGLWRAARFDPFGAAGNVGSAAISAGASRDAAAIQAQATGNALAVQQGVFNAEQANLAPFISQGQATSGIVGELVGINGNLPGGFDPNSLLLAPFSQNSTYALPGTVASQNPNAPASQVVPGAPATPVYGQPGSLNIPGAPTSPVLTLDQFRASPGYRYQLDQTMQAIQNSAAARGSAVSGNTLNALQANAQGLANQDWWNAYNANAQQFDRAQALQSSNYWNDYNASQQNFLNGYNAYTQRVGNILATLTGLAGNGQNAAVNLGSAGGTFANNAGQLITGGANAAAAGRVGVANAINSGIGGLSQTNSAANTNALIATLTGNPVGSTGYGFGSNYLLSRLLGSGGGSTFSNVTNTTSGSDALLANLFGD